MLGIPAGDLLRSRDKAMKILGLTGEEPEEDLIEHMSENPTLIQRPIGVLGERAVIGRPIERLLDLVHS
jgi:arsenate reductase